jgi:hypothetical protein
MGRARRGGSCGRPCDTSGSDAGAVRTYYERNTRLFLALGFGGKARAIHRAVWAEGVRGAEEAFNTTNRLVLHEAERLAAVTPLKVLDLGCGVGGSLFYLARHLASPLRATGVTICPLQVWRTQPGCAWRATTTSLPVCAFSACRRAWRAACSAWGAPRRRAGLTGTAPSEAWHCNNACAPG